MTLSASATVASALPLTSALAVLRAIFARLAAERDLVRLYEAGLLEIAAFFNARQAVLLLLDQDTGAWFSPCAAIRLDDRQVAGLCALLTSRGAALAQRWPEPAVVRLGDPGDRYLFEDELVGILEEEDVLLARMEVEGRILGVLCLANRGDGLPFSADEAHLLGYFAGHLSMAIHGLEIALENERMLREMQHHVHEAERRSREMALLGRVSAALSASLDLEDVGRSIVTELAAALDVAQVGLVLFDWQAGYGKLVAEYQAIPDDSGGDTLIPIADNLSLAQVVATKAPLPIRDAQHDPLLASIHHLMARRGVKSILLLPLVVRGEVIGTIGVDELDHVRDFSQAEVELAQTITNQAATAVANARLFADAHRRAVQMQTIQEVTSRITAILDPEQLLYEVADLLAERFGYYHVHVFLADDEGRYLLATGGNGEVGRLLVQSGLRLAIGQEGICGWAAGVGHTVVVNDVSQEPRYYHNSLLAGVRSEMAVPMKLRGRLVGLLNVESDHTAAFDDTDRFLIETLADQVAIALENARLFRTVQERARQLAAALDELKALDRMKDEFVQTVSHELRTPLTFIKGYVELMLEGDLGPVSSDQTGALAIMAQRTENVIRLVNDIISLTRGESSELDLVPQDLAEIARRATGSAQAVIGQARIVLATEFDPDLPRVLGDAQRLGQVFDNLLGNAIKFSPDGGEIVVRLYQAGGMVRAEIGDHGIGIPASHLHRVWDRFYQVEGTTTRRFGGTGLGLAIVKRLVEAHGGEVGAESFEGQGSTFWFTVPVAE